MDCMYARASVRVLMFNCSNVARTGNFYCCKAYFYNLLSDIDVRITC